MSCAVCLIWHDQRERSDLKRADADPLTQSADARAGSSLSLVTHRWKDLSSRVLLLILNWNSKATSRIRRWDSRLGLETRLG